MQIASIPPPIITTPLAQDVASKAVPNPQATQPLVPNAVKQPPKGEKSNHSGQNPEKHSSHARQEGATDKDPQNPEKGDGHSVNISV